MIDTTDSLTHCEEEESLAGSYFVAAYPPFSSWNRELADEYCQMLSEPNDQKEPFGLYVHIPFCEVRCPYCYYLSHARQSTERIDAYVDALIREVSLYSQAPHVGGRPIDYVYFGGGTPSTMNPEQIRRLTSEMQAIYSWDRTREITYECAPRTVTDERLSALREAGVTRISMGVQQLNDEILSLNGRVHGTADVLRAHERIRKAGFDILNLDLMVGLVGESDTTFFESLDRIVELDPDSVTLYQLEIPLNTPLYKALDRTVATDQLASWDLKRDRLAKAFEILESAGYVVRSAYAAAKTSHQSFVYQDAQYAGGDLVGLGASAFSYVDGWHGQNLPKLDDYMERAQDPQLPVGRAHHLTDSARMVREFILQLKIGSVDRGRFRERFDVDVAEEFAEPLAEFVSEGWIESNGDAIRLTRDGLLRVDRLLPAFFLPEHQNIRYS